VESAPDDEDGSRQLVAYGGPGSAVLAQPSAPPVSLRRSLALLPDVTLACACVRACCGAALCAQERRPRPKALMLKSYSLTSGALEAPRFEADAGAGRGFDQLLDAFSLHRVMIRKA
jgi:hypothetical protein